MSEEKPNTEYPCSILWVQLPIMSWILPVFGHLAITDSKGYSYDFQGSYTIVKGKTQFGVPRKFLKLDVDPQALDKAINESIEDFKKVKYSFLSTNCHYYVGKVLDKVPQVKPPSGEIWADEQCNSKLAQLMKKKGQFVSSYAAFMTYLPLLIIMTMIILIIKLL